jgi:hypothetical protein
LDLFVIPVGEKRLPPAPMAQAGTGILDLKKLAHNVERLKKYKGELANRPWLILNKTF